MSVQLTMVNGGTPLGYYVSGSIEEDVIDQITGKDYGWVSGGNNTSPLYCQNNLIYDTQGQNFTDADWATIAVGEIYSDVEISYRLTTTDCCGGTVKFLMGAIELKRCKVSTSTWQVQ